MQKSCGNCKHFSKFKSWTGRVGPSGLCELFDARTPSDGGYRCQHHKYIKFHRDNSLKVKQ